MSSPAWTPLGPACVIHEDNTTASGRISAIALDPADPDQTIYAGAASGGVWKTTNGGRDWTPLTDSQETLGTGCITLDHGRVIVGTGEFSRSDVRAQGMGLLISSDGGQNWQRLPADNTFDGLTISAIVIDPANQNHCFAGTNGGLLENVNLSDATVRWTPVAGVSDPVSDMVLDQSDAANPVLFVAQHKKGVFQRPLSGGVFAAIPGPPDSALGVIRLSLSAKEPGVVYAAFETAATPGSIVIFATVTNQGQVGWQPRGSVSDQTQGDYNLALAVSPHDSKRILCGGQNLWRSTDAGKSWSLLRDTPAVHPDLHVILFHPTDPKVIWVGTDGGMFRSPDSGNTWQHRNRGLQALQLFEVAQHPHSDSVLLGGTQDNGAVRFEGSAAWVLSGEGDAFQVSIDPNNPSTWYYGYVWEGVGLLRLGAVNRSDNAGGGYTPRIKNLDPNDFGGGKHDFKLILDPSPPSTLYAGTNRIYVSTDRGDSWKRIKTGSGATLADFLTGPTALSQIRSLAIAPNRIYVGTEDGQFFLIQQAPDGSRTATSPMTGLPGSGSTAHPISDIAVHPTDPDKIYLAIGSDHDALDNVFSQPIPQPRLFRRDDGWGNTGKWTRLTVAATRPNPVGGKPAITANAVNCLAIDPRNPTHVYAGCDVEVFLSTDGGDTWDWWNDNLPNVVVLDLAIQQEARLMRAATMGRGVWESPLDVPAAGHAGIFLRDDALDLGHFWRQPTPEGPNPFNPKTSETIFSGADLKVDNDSFKYLPPFTGGFNKPDSTIDFTSGGAIDYIGFHDIKAPGPRKGADSRVYLQVNNRGPQPATAVQARLFWANKSGSAFPDLPADFWTKFPGADPADTSKWHPIGPAQTISKLLPAEPQILTFTWPSDGIDDPVGVLAVITSPDDPLNESRFSIADIVPNNNHIILKQMGVGTRSGLIVLGVIALAGLLAVGGVEAYKKITGSN